MYDRRLWKQSQFFPYFKHTTREQPQTKIAFLERENNDIIDKESISAVIGEMRYFHTRGVHTYTRATRRHTILPLS